MDLDLARVQAFVAVVDEAHFGRAAEALSISQQAVSKRVARLEAELGVRLLTRGANGVTLTAAGRRFLRAGAAGADRGPTRDRGGQAGGTAAAG